MFPDTDEKWSSRPMEEGIGALLEEAHTILISQLLAANQFQWAKFHLLDKNKKRVVEELSKAEVGVFSKKSLQGVTRQIIDLEYQIDRKLKSRKETILLKLKALNRKTHVFRNSILRYQRYSS